jgi:glycogen debranching enzyme
MQELTPPNEPYSILVESPRHDDQTRVLKHGETFAVFDHFGDIDRANSDEQGLYHQGTRHLSRLRMSINGRSPLLLSSTVREDNCLLTVDLTNPDFTEDNAIRLSRDTIHVFLSVFLFEGRCYCRFRLHNYALVDVKILWALAFEADFRDIFEVRGTRRSRRGELLDAELKNEVVCLRYRGLDEVIRTTALTFTPHPRRISDSKAQFDVALPPKGDWTCELTIDSTTDQGQGQRPFADAFILASAQLRSDRSHEAHVATSNTQFNEWLDRSAADLHMLVTDTSHGPYPYAGVPWFSTAFGRDGIITALEYLWINPRLARGVLQYLAATQAQTIDAASDAQPGKILHETRRGEMAELNEIPFRQYYGTADATPLFIMLAHAYYVRTADRELVATLWPNIEKALHWIDEYADMDGDGFFEYARQSDVGLVTQGWKDSADSVFHADGQLAEPPIALCEVQGYVYAAWRSAAALATSLGLADDAARLIARSDQLKRSFDEAFWCEELGTYAIALDRYKKPCRVRTSNAGHLLFSGIADQRRARSVAAFLLGESMFSGWGIRTVATQETRYNPMAYHNGSIWPHDNALIAYGLANYGFQQEAVKILAGLFDASLAIDLHRMPELFCGFPRRDGEGPTLYPVACAPQAWAAGAVFLLLQSCIGLTLDATENKICFRRPTLPVFLDRVFVRNLSLNDAVVDLVLERHDSDVGVNVMRRVGNVEIIVTK